MTTTPHTATPNLPSEHARSSSQFIVCPAPSPTHKLRATWPDGRHETFPCRAGDTVEIGPKTSYVRERTVRDPDDRAVAVTVRVHGDMPRLVMISLEAIELTRQAFALAERAGEELEAWSRRHPETRAHGAWDRVSRG